MHSCSAAQNQRNHAMNQRMQSSEESKSGSLLGRGGSLSRGRKPQDDAAPNPANSRASLRLLV
eukprot:11174283-Alexandrium_andersonii.AAC.1